MELWSYLVCLRSESMIPAETRPQLLLTTGRQDIRQKTQSRGKKEEEEERGGYLAGNQTPVHRQLLGERRGHNENRQSLIWRWRWKSFLTFLVSGRRFPLVWKTEDEQNRDDKDSPDTDTPADSAPVAAMATPFPVTRSPFSSSSEEDDKECLD